MLLSSAKTEFKVKEHQVDFCIVGGGMSGMLAAIAAARHGLRVLLMNDRPVVGGNASSEIRMWIRGAHGDNTRETGILEEIALENIYRNPGLNFSVWDSVLYEKVRFEPNIDLVLNCSCMDIKMENGRIAWIKGWQTTTHKWHMVRAKLFADCSGDSVLGPLSGAEWRMGREASDEFNEDIEPSKADAKTMGLSCMIQARETGSSKPYIAPKWANKYTKKDLPFRIDLSTPSSWANDNFWWMELGGEADSIDDAEEIKDELLKIAFGAWDFVKNSGHCDADKWELDWVGFLPGKRESRRYVGDHMLTQNDIRSEGRFDDIVAYGGWSMDDHNPAGINWPGAPAIFHPAPSPYGIPYRCLYSKNIPNLFFAGRNISATHAALSSTRVMATCAMLGQAVGTAAAIAVRDGLDPRGVYESRIDELKQTLMDDDSYLPWNKRRFSESMKNVKIKSSSGDASALGNGIDRQVGVDYNGWKAPVGESLTLEFASEVKISEVRIVFDSDLNRETWQGVGSKIKMFPMRCNIFASDKGLKVPATIVRAFRLEIPDGKGGWKTVISEDNNYQRLVRIKLDVCTAGLRLVPERTWGSKEASVFAFDVK